MISNLVKDQVRSWMDAVGRVVARTGMTPDMATVLGLVINGGVAVVFATGHLRLGGLLLLIVAPFDMLDGALARATGKTSTFGAFLDSTLDRYSESVLFFGLLWQVMHDLGNHQTERALLIFASVTGSLLVSYARARAEALGYDNEVGLLARPERVVALGVFLLIGGNSWYGIDAVLWILAVATHFTAIQRIVHVWRISRDRQGDAPTRVARTPRFRAWRAAREGSSWWTPRQR